MAEFSHSGGLVPDTGHFSSLAGAAATRRRRIEGIYCSAARTVSPFGGKVGVTVLLDEACEVLLPWRTFAPIDATFVPLTHRRQLSPYITLDRSSYVPRVRLKSGYRLIITSILNTVQSVATEVSKPPRIEC